MAAAPGFGRGALGCGGDRRGHHARRADRRARRAALRQDRRRGLRGGGARRAAQPVPWVAFEYLPAALGARGRLRRPARGARPLRVQPRPRRDARLRARPLAERRVCSPSPRGCRGRSGDIYARLAPMADGRCAARPCGAARRGAARGGAGAAGPAGGAGRSRCPLELPALVLLAPRGRRPALRGALGLADRAGARGAGAAEARRRRRRRRPTCGRSTRCSTSGSSAPPGSSGRGSLGTPLAPRRRRGAGCWRSALVVAAAALGGRADRAPRAAAEAGRSRSAALAAVALVAVAAVAGATPLVPADADTARLAWEHVAAAPAARRRPRALRGRGGGRPLGRRRRRRRSCRGSRGTDVIVVFVESYGRSALDEPALRPDGRRRRCSDGEAALAARASRRARAG